MMFLSVYRIQSCQIPVLNSLILYSGNLVLRNHNLMLEVFNAGAQCDEIIQAAEAVTEEIKPELAAQIVKHIEKMIEDNEAEAIGTNCPPLLIV